MEPASYKAVFVGSTSPHETHRLAQRLSRGSRVAVVASSSGVLDRPVFNEGVRELEHFGLEVLTGSAVHEVRCYLAEEDDRRAEDLLWALTDASVDGIWCSRGGYGAQTYLRFPRHDCIRALYRATYQVFIGFSDVTVLHALITSRLGWITRYRPGISKLRNATDYTLNDVPHYLKRSRLWSHRDRELVRSRRS